MELMTFGVGMELKCCQICYSLPELPEGLVELTTTSLITMDKYVIINLFSVIEAKMTKYVFGQYFCTDSIIFQQ